MGAYKSRQTGRKVFRQYVIGDYIVDFLFPEINLVVEVDGAYHSEREQIEDDERRERDLNKMNYNVIRFSNEEILYDIEKVIERILKELEYYE